ncbi:MAG: hypothetical protein HRF50_00180 [Phycisphaerae bacterium]
MHGHDAATGARIVLVDRRRRCASAGLPAAALARLENALGRGVWFGDRFARKTFRAAALETLRREAPGGLAIIGPGIHFDVPPPFSEHFEPIQLGAADAQLKTLSGAAPTRQERYAGVSLALAGAIVALVLTMMLLPTIRTGNLRLIGAPLFAVATIGLTLAIVFGLRRLAGTWYLLPGAVAVVRAFGPRAERLALRTRLDSCLVLRYDRAGKTVGLYAELLSERARILRTRVSEREALSLLAAWQSARPPPAPQQLQELVN